MKENFKITIEVKDGAVKWDFSSDVMEQQFLDILRVIQDQILVDRSVRVTKQIMSKEAGRNIRQVMEMNNIKGKM